tara:strand:+ start:1874 stop:2092 length:219 start_codon:yes stop_codon:yes gene_type:complete
MDSTVPASHYIDEMSRLSKDIFDLEKEVKHLKLALIDIKSKSTDIQFYGGVSENLSGIVNEIIEKINKTLGS